jgi:hypothetical protein
MNPQNSLAPRRLFAADTAKESYDLSLCALVAVEEDVKNLCRMSSVKYGDSFKAHFNILREHIMLHTNTGAN